MIRKTFKYRLNPTKHQVWLLENTLDICRCVYNKTLETRKNAWETKKTHLSRYDTFNLLPKWKEGDSRLKDAHSSLLQNALARLDIAFNDFFNRIKKGEKPGHPRFKGFGRYDSFTFPHYPDGGFKFIGGRLRLSKIGDINIVLHRPVRGTIKTLTIRRSSARKWHACFSCEVKENHLPKNDASVGIDLGLTSFATISNGKKIENPHFFKKEAKALAKAQRRLSKCEKGTLERRKYGKVVCKIHERIANKRKDFAHKLSRVFVNKYGKIFCEDLNIRKMMEGGFLAKSIGDASWRQFIQFMAYKAKEAGRTFGMVDPRNTSKMCSRCGELVEKKLSDRIHNCPHCSLSIDRDINAAINILRLGVQSFG